MGGYDFSIGFKVIPALGITYKIFQKYINDITVSLFEKNTSDSRNFLFRFDDFSIVIHVQYLSIKIRQFVYNFLIMLFLLRTSIVTFFFIYDVQIDVDYRRNFFLLNIVLPFF